jgi:hypothetical protein
MLVANQYIPFLHSFAFVVAVVDLAGIASIRGVSCERICVPLTIDPNEESHGRGTDRPFNSRDQI